MMNDSGSGIEPTPLQNVSAQYVKIQRQYQQILDRWTPYVLNRWLATAGLLLVFLLRIVLAQGVSSLLRVNALRCENRPVLTCRPLVVYWSVFSAMFSG